jgi:hypothetical protein
MIVYSFKCSLCSSRNKIIKMNVTYKLIVLVCTLVTIASCSSFGPKRIATDSFNYNNAIGQAANEQMLLNLVRLHNFDVPVFLSVSSVLTQYVYSGQVGVEATTANSVGANADSAGINSRIIYIERPTITYTPLSGQEFAEQLLTPLSMETLFSLAQSGWPAELLLIMGLERLGPFKNLPIYTSHPKSEKSLNDFVEAIQIILKLSYDNAIEFRETNANNNSDKETLMLHFSNDASQQSKLLWQKLKQKLNLKPSINKFRIVDKITNLHHNEILIRTRSLLALMSHLAQGVGTDTLNESENNILYLKLLPLNIQQSEENPPNTFVSVKYNNKWYYISQSDNKSKQIFGMLTYIYLLQAPKPHTSGPLITVPAG